jgi:hypothetical protein
VWHKKNSGLFKRLFFYGGALTAEWREYPDWSSRTEQSYRLERDRLIARIEKLGSYFLNYYRSYQKKDSFIQLTYWDL